MTDALDIDALLGDPSTSIIVCCGSGGVGKTTTSAALALRAAERGRNVVVLTIDPARRLATALGLDGLHNEPQAVPVHGSGSLSALMLDMKQTFDDLVREQAGADRADEILNNRLYRVLSTSFSGTQEYMAMEKLSALAEQSRVAGQWDLIVVDTPPSRSALDFLDAPARLGSFLDGPLMRAMLAPARHGGRWGLRAVGAGMGIVNGAMERIVGRELLSDARTLVTALDLVFGSFRTRADATYRLLSEPGTAFLVIATPERDALREAAFFIDRLARDALPIAGMIVNRTHRPRADWLTADGAAAAARTTARGSDAALATLADELLNHHARLARRHEAERRLIDATQAPHPAVPRWEVAALPDDVHDVDGLRRIGEQLSSR